MRGGGQRLEGRGEEIGFIVHETGSHWRTLIRKARWSDWHLGKPSGCGVEEAEGQG